MKFSPRDRILLGVIVAVIAVGGFFKLVLTPEHHKAAHLETQIAAARVALGKAQQQELLGRAAAVAERSAQTDWNAAQRAVPKVANIPSLLKVLARNAAAVHVSMQSITLSSSGESSTATTSATTATTGPTAIPVSLTFTGGYQALNRFVDRLDTFVTVSHRQLRAAGPLVGISAVDVTPAPSTTNPSKLSVQLTATIYQRSAASSGASGSTEGAT